jgi:hypothetical protein
VHGVANHRAVDGHAVLHDEVGRDPAAHREQDGERLDGVAVRRTAGKTRGKDRTRPAGTPLGPSSPCLPHPGTSAPASRSSGHCMRRIKPPRKRPKTWCARSGTEPGKTSGTIARPVKRLHRTGSPIRDRREIRAVRDGVPGSATSNSARIASSRPGGGAARWNI